MWRGFGGVPVLVEQVSQHCARKDTPMDRQACERVWGLSSWEGFIMRETAASQCLGWTRAGDVGHLQVIERLE